MARTNDDFIPNADPLNGGRFPTPEQTRGWMRARHLTQPVLRSTALPSRLPAVRQALAADLDALDGIWFDPVRNSRAICVRALLPTYVPGPAPALEAALLDTFQVSLDASESGVRVPRWMPSRMRRRLRASDRRFRDTMEPLLSGCPRADHADHVDHADHGEQGESGRHAEHGDKGCDTVLEQLHAQSEPVPRDVAMGALGFSFLGAIGTMGAAWCWLLFCLAAHPDALRRIHDESTAASADEIAGDPERALPYTHAFVREVLRVYPPAWLLGRDAVTDLTLGGYDIPAGTAVMVSPYLLHHDPRHWDAPDRFSPERWLNDAPPHTPHSYLPFASGPRGCLGSRLGAAVLLLTAAHIAAHQRLEAPDLDGVTPRFGTSLTPRGMSCRLLRHDRSHSK
ncbi:hypothetical protein BU196_19210 [Streptomyces sp. CBMA370]|nr:hypothetical protein [Streptomyces sp. CBMA370]